MGASGASTTLRTEKRTVGAELEAEEGADLLAETSALETEATGVGAVGKRGNRSRSRCRVPLVSRGLRRGFGALRVEAEERCGPSHQRSLFCASRNRQRMRRNRGLCSHGTRLRAEPSAVTILCK